MRVERVIWDGQPAWKKRVEQLHGRMRLRKGNAQRAFDRELAAYKALAGRGLPMAPILAEGADFFVLADGGPTLRDLARDISVSKADLTTAIRAAATCLGQLHRAGVSHGRPAIKDICYKDGVVTLIDWERGAPKRDTPKGHAEDVLLFFFSLFPEERLDRTDIDAARLAYLTTAPAAIWPLAQHRIRRLRPLRWLAAPLLRAMAHKPDYRAVDPFLEFFAAPADDPDPSEQ